MFKKSQFEKVEYNHKTLQSSENLNTAKQIHELVELKQAVLKDIEWINKCSYNTSDIKATLPRHDTENFRYLIMEGAKNKDIEKNKRLLT